jgi:phosphatidylinositol-3-phosphatase
MRVWKCSEALAAGLPTAVAALVCCLCFGPLFLAVATAAPPRYDHIVIVMEENRTPTQIIGDLVNAPYINSLATNGVIMGGMFAITHPSQPNYIHLFSGADQGILDDNLPPNFSTTPTATYPFRTANLGAELIAAGFTFVGYSEQIESAGTNDWADYDPHSATHPGIYYRRKHSPWVNWIAKVSPVPANQLTNTLNKAFTQFPTNYAELPTVCFVIPNQQNDMHDGSRKQGDDWLRNNLDAYAKWAKTNNSLLIITWDEDDFNNVNQIPTILYGANLRDGTVVGGTWTHHNTLRTLEDMYGTTHAGAAAQVRPIVGPFLTDPSVNSVTFRQGANGYSGAQDTQIWAETPTTDYSTNHTLTADLDTASGTAGNQEAQILVRFNGLFGNAAGQVPTNAIIHSAKLIMFTPLSPSGQDFDSDDTFRAHRMIADWSDTATWNSTVNGVSVDNVEAASSASFSLTGEVDGAPAIFDVTGDIELFRSGTPNRGWCIRPSSSGTGNGWVLGSSETNIVAYRPALEITYSLPLSPYAAWALSKGLTLANNAPDADPDRDGAPNVAEFAYNLNPLASDARPVAPGGTNGLPAARYLAGVSGGILEIEFVRRKGPTALGLSYLTQFSPGVIGSWVNGQSPTVTSLNSDWERVVIRDSVPGPNTQRFGKVVVTLNP